MSKKITVFLFGILLVAVACDLANREENPPGENKEKENEEANKLKKLEAMNPGNPSAPIAEKPAETKPKTPTQYDSVALDNKVKDDAVRLNKDVKTHRVLVRTDPDGTKIYRMIGMHVIVNPNGEEAFLPDEI